MDMGEEETSGQKEGWQEKEEKEQRKDINMFQSSIRDKGHAF